MSSPYESFHTSFIKQTSRIRRVEEAQVETEGGDPKEHIRVTSETKEVTEVGPDGVEKTTSSDSKTSGEKK